MKRIHFWFYYFIIVMFGMLMAQNESFCSGNVKNEFVMFSKKTAYKFVKGNIKNEHEIPSCKPIKFWATVRHGATLPSYSVISRMQILLNLQQKILSNYKSKYNFKDFKECATRTHCLPMKGIVINRSNMTQVSNDLHCRREFRVANLVEVQCERFKKMDLCDRELRNLDAWRSEKILKYNLDSIEPLTSQGYDDMKTLAESLQSYFPELLQDHYTDSNYQFYFTSMNRVKHSYEAFIDGLFGAQVARQIKPLPFVDNEKLLIPYKACHAWLKGVNSNDTTFLEAELFRRSPVYQGMLENISDRLGLTSVLTKAKIKLLYDICRFEKAASPGEFSAWCSVFRREHFVIQEFYEDLRYYYNGGHGHPMNEVMGCPPIRQMMNFFTKAVEKKDVKQPAVKINFVHSTMMLLLVTSLGLFRDPWHLTASSFTEPWVEGRLSSISNVYPFTSNLVAVLYSCETGEKHRVKFFMNEKAVYIDGCLDSACPWSIIANKYSTLAAQCDLEFCKKNYRQI